MKGRVTVVGRANRTGADATPPYPAAPTRRPSPSANAAKPQCYRPNLPPGGAKPIALQLRAKQPRRLGSMLAKTTATTSDNALEIGT